MIKTFIALILFPSLLLGFICIISMQIKPYIWAIILLIAIINAGAIVVFQMLKRKTALAQQKSDFVFNISHELKTPLTAINMFIEMLLFKIYKDENEAEEYICVIQKECNRLIYLVDRVLDFAKIEKCKKEFHYQQEKIDEVIHYTLGIFQDQLVGNDCEIIVNIAENLPKLSIDRDAISEALMNLLNNAVKYSLEKKRIIINAKIVNKYIAIEVIDNGIGISEHQQKRIFEPFYRINDPLLKSVEGTGLGLSYVKHIVDAHKGKVMVQSEIGNGSKFTLMLPKGKHIDTDSDS